MKKLILYLLLLLPVIALAQTTPATLKFRQPVPVNSKDSVGYQIEGNPGAIRWLGNLELIRSLLGNTVTGILTGDNHFTGLDRFSQTIKADDGIDITGNLTATGEISSSSANLGDVTRSNTYEVGSGVGGALIRFIGGTTGSGYDLVMEYNVATSRFQIDWPNASHRIFSIDTLGVARDAADNRYLTTADTSSFGGTLKFAAEGLHLNGDTVLGGGTLSRDLNITIGPHNYNIVANDTSFVNIKNSAGTLFTQIFPGFINVQDSLGNHSFVDPTEIEMNDVTDNVQFDVNQSGIMVFQTTNQSFAVSDANGLNFVMGSQNTQLTPIGLFTSTNIAGADLSPFVRPSGAGGVLIANNISNSMTETDFISFQGVAPFAIGGFHFTVIDTLGVKKDLLDINGLTGAIITDGTLTAGTVNHSAATNNNFVEIDQTDGHFVYRSNADVISDLGISGGSGVSSFNTRTGAVVPVAGDYAALTESLTHKDLTDVTNTFRTLNQNTTGSAAKWTTLRALAGNLVDGSGDVQFANKFIMQGTGDGGMSAAQFMGNLATGIVKNTGTTGVQSIAVAADFPALNQNTTGSAAKWTTGRTISISGDMVYTSPSIDGSGNVTGAGTLATVNSNTGGFGDGTHVGTFTVDAKGRITAASNTTISFPVYTADGGLSFSGTDFSIDHTFANVWTAKQQSEIDNLGTTKVAGFETINTQPATSTQKQISPMLSMVGQGWNNATSASISVGMQFYASSANITGAAPIGLFAMRSLIGGSGGSTMFQVDSPGNFLTSGTFVTGSYTVATLPTTIFGSTTVITGTTAVVTDALAPTYSANVVGGGTVVTRVMWNGSHWICE